MVGLIVSFTLAAIVAILLVRGIDDMEKNHPDYKGDDFL